MDDNPNLPRLYELVVLDEVDDILVAVSELAQQGRDEGTLLWVGEQYDAHGKRGGSWFAPTGNLHFALILRPEMMRTKALELCLVAQVAMYSALAGLIAPGMDIRFRWPNDLLVNGAKFATLNVAAKSDVTGCFEYLVLAFSVNLTRHPNDAEFPATSVLEEQGEMDFGNVELLASFGRHFLSWLNRWVDEGLPPIKRVWQNYVSDVDVALSLPDREVLVSEVVLGDDGSLQATDSSEQVVTMTLSEFWGIT